MAKEVRMMDLVVGEYYMLPENFDATIYPHYLNGINIVNALKDRPHKLIDKTVYPPSTLQPDGSIDIGFQPDAQDTAAGIHFLQFTSDNMLNDKNQIFITQKSLSNVYKNRGTEFGVRNAFERSGIVGYNPVTNLIVKQATGVRYTPNPYQRKSRKTKRRNNLRKGRRAATVRRKL